MGQQQQKLRQLDQHHLEQFGEVVSSMKVPSKKMEDEDARLSKELKQEYERMKQL